MENKVDLALSILETPSGKKSVNYQVNGMTGTKNNCHELNQIALHVAVSDSRLSKLVKPLLNAGADIHSNKEGRTPFWMFCCSRNEDKDVMITLIKAGSNINQAVKYLFL